MGRIRTVKPELFKHEQLFDLENVSELPLRLAYIGLFTKCDREGRFKWRPRELKLDILPYDDIDFSYVLEVLRERKFIIQYEVDGELFGYIPSWHKHQVINNREAESTLPAPVLNDAILTRKQRVTHASSTPLSFAPGEGKGREEEGKDICKVSLEISPHSSIDDDFANTEKSKIGTNESILPQQKDEVLQIFEHWKSVMKHPNAKLDSNRKRKIQSALKLGFSLEQLKQAIDGCTNTAFNMGKNNEGKKYDGISVIFKDAEQIERFISNASVNNNKSNSSATVSQIDQLAQGAI